MAGIGLAQRLAGGILQGVGQGIIVQAQQRRQDTLNEMRRKWQVEDREVAHTRADERQARSDARADARAAENRAHAEVMAGNRLVPTGTDDGGAVYTPQREATGKSLPTKPRQGSTKMVKVIGPDGKPMLVPESKAAGMRPYLAPVPTSVDPVTGTKSGYRRPGDLIAEGDRAAAKSVADAVEAAAAKWVEDNAGWFRSDETDFGGSREKFQAMLAERLARDPGTPISTHAAHVKAALQGGEDTTKDGEPVRGADGGLYVKQNGRWHRYHPPGAF